MTRLAYVGVSLTLTRDAVVLELPDLSGDDAKYAAARREVPFSGIDEVNVFDHALGSGARLVVASRETILAKDYPEAEMARQARRIILRAIDQEGAVARSRGRGDGRLEEGRGCS